MNYGGHLVLINIVLCMRYNSLKLNIYYQAFKSSFYKKKSSCALFAKMTAKIILLSKLHYGISKPKFKAEQHISRIVGTILIDDYFFWQPLRKV